MHLRARIFPTVILCLLAGQVSAQDIQVFASVGDRVVGAQETVTFTVEIRGNADGLQTPGPPATEGLALAQTFPSTQRNVSIVNGAISQSVSFTWTYRPVQEGNATFGPVTVQVAGSSFATDPISIEVVPQSQRPGRANPPARTDPFAPFRPQTAPEEPADPNEEDLFIRVIPSARRAVQNQQVTLAYRLYFREGIQLRQSRLTDSWDAEGFWREELDVEARPIPQIVVEDGIRYNVITLKRAAFFPTRAGELRVDPLKIESEAILPVRNRDPFAQFFSLRSRYSPVELSSPPFSVNVSTLPTGAPDDFDGAVGSYRFEAVFDRSELEVGESLQLRVRISGAGNVATLAPPTFEVPGAFEQYDPRIETRIDRSGSILTGSKTFTYVLVPRSNGEYEMPAISFSYYDPAARGYRTRSSDPVSVRVTGTGTAPALAMSGGLPVDDIAGPMVGAADWSPTDTTPWHRRPFVYLLLLLPIGGLAALEALSRRADFFADNPGIARLRRAHPLARRHLKEADAELDRDDPRAFYESLVRAVMGFIGNRLNVSEHGLTRADLGDRLRTAGVPEDLTRRVTGFLDACDLARFAPIRREQADMQRDREQAAELIITLDGALVEA